MCSFVFFTFFLLELIVATDMIVGPRSIFWVYFSFVFVCYFFHSLFENLIWPKRFVYFSDLCFFLSLCFRLFGFRSSRKWQIFTSVYPIRSRSLSYRFVLVVLWFVANVKFSIVPMQRKWNIWRKKKWKIKFGIKSKANKKI